MSSTGASPHGVEDVRGPPLLQKTGGRGGGQPRGKTAPAKVIKPPHPKPPAGKDGKPKASVIKSSGAREPPKKLFRIAIRKLPARDFTDTGFASAVDRVCSDSASGLQRDCFQVEHFIPGKIR
jgi:hypothetical protein